MTSLTAIPEPGAASIVMILMAALGILGHGRIGYREEGDWRAY
jgi:hypothetical protein